MVSYNSPGPSINSYSDIESMFEKQVVKIIDYLV